MGHSFRFSTSFLRIRCDRKFPSPDDTMRRGGRISRPDSIRCVYSNVRKSQARTLSAGRSAHVTSSFSSIHPVIRRTYPLASYLFLFSLPTVSHFRVCPLYQRENQRKERKRERKRARGGGREGERERKCALFLETLFYTSVRLTLNRNERRSKTWSRVIGVLMWF